MGLEEDEAGISIAGVVESEVESYLSKHSSPERIEKRDVKNLHEIIHKVYLGQTGRNDLERSQVKNLTREAFEKRDYEMIVEFEKPKSERFHYQKK